MWFPFLVIDGLFLYGLIGIFSLLALVSMQYERPGLCTVVVAVALAVLQYYSPLQPISFIIHRPIDAAMIAGAYFAAGSIWILIKWFSHVYKIRDRFHEVKDQIIKGMKSDFGTFPNDYFNQDGSLTLNGSQLLHVRGATRIHERELPPQVSHHKAEIYMWWLCWPLSLIWTMLSDPIIRLWNFVYNLFGNMMQTISDNAFRVK